jgi:peptide/nickel transport system substrate-binding protein
MATVVDTSYWHGIVTKRHSRRQILAASGGGVAAALLVACGGGSSDKGPKASDLIVPVADETKSARQGGVLKRVSASPPSFDARLAGSSTLTAYLVQGQLLNLKAGTLASTDGSLVGGVIESWELSPDRLTLTMKTDPAAHFGNQAPVNGRSVDTRDVLFSWDQLRSGGGRRQDIVNAVNPDAPVASVTATDDRTVVMKFSSPLATTLYLLANDLTGVFHIYPREAGEDRNYNWANKPIGAGPYQVKRNDGDTGYSFERNPGFKQDKGGKALPYIDEIEYAVAPEYSAGLAQFSTGAIHEFTPLADDVLPTKRRVMELELKAAPSTASLTRVFFGQLPGSPFRDERMRQAWVLCWDRDLWLDTVYNKTKFEAEGLPVEVQVEGALAKETFEGWYLNPRSKEFGVNSRFFNHDIAEAKKLVAAAGHTGLRTKVTYPAQPYYGGDFYKLADIAINMVRDAGVFTLDLNLPQRTEWLDRFLNIRGGQVESGVVHFADILTLEPTNSLFGKYHSAGSRYMGGDATMDDLLNRALREFDDNKRKALIHELQRHEGAKNFFPRVGSGSAFSLAWPVLRNRHVYRNGTGREQAIVRMFMDQTKAPLNKA